MLNALRSFFSSIFANGSLQRRGDRHESSDSFRSCTSSEDVDVYSIHHGMASDHGGTDWDSFQPAVNIDGTPMVGSVDMNGNIYGVTSHDYSSFDDGASSSGCDLQSDNTFGCSDSWSGSDTWSSSDSFSSGCSSDW